MNNKKSLKEPCSGFRGLPCLFWISVLLGWILFTMPVTVTAQPKEEKKYKIVLKSRTILPKPGIKPQLQERLKAELDRDEKRHVFIQLKRFLNIEERAEFEEHGVKLLSYVGGYAWYALLTDSTPLKFAQPDVVKRIPALGSIRWIGAIEPTDRVAPEVLEPRMNKWIKTRDNRERYSVYFFKDVPMEVGRQIIRKYGGEIKGEVALSRGFYVVFPPGVREKLMAEEAVKLIDLYPPPDIHDNDGSRAWTHTNIVHAAGRTGTGVVLGQWEAGNGLPRNVHVDLTNGRVHWEDAGGIVHYHATHVAGTMVGTGTGNVFRMGHAPGVGNVRCYTSTGAPGEMVASMNSFGVVAANCSYGKGIGWARSGGVWYFEPSTGAGDPINAYPQTYFGDYRWECPNFDEVVRKQGLVIVFSAGNDRNDPGDGSETNAQPGDWDQIVGADSWDGYHTIRANGTAKNVITVGSIDDSDSSMSDHSNWGPTDDGRIKPDIVAPGVNISSCNNGDGDGNGSFDDYRVLSGTSMAAPAVTGIVALMIQSYREDYLGVPDSTLTPLPSTIKALLCHSADDMGNAGPDYQFGWGGIRANEARQLILNKKFLEGLVLEIDDYDVYEFTAVGGEPEIRITMTWDDYQAAAGNPDPTIINDLDLVVEDPDGNFYTPWRLHVTGHADIGDVAERQKHTVASINDIPEAARDRWNNVEQVFIDETLVGGPLPGGTWKVYVNAHALPEPPQRYSLVVNEYRLQGYVDVMQVLDRSGSMGRLASSDSTETKIQVLRNAADQFIHIMKSDIGNQLGLVQFNQDVVPFDPAHQADLSELTTARAGILRTTTVPSIVHGGATSIGDGLSEALSQLTGASAVPEHDKVILLVTDGKENTPQWISDVRDALIADNIVVYPLGLGYSSGINEAKLTELAEATGGSYRITSDLLIFHKFFLEILAGAVDWAVALDPVGELEEGETVWIPITISSDQESATFTVYWEGIDNAIDLELVPPSGPPITPRTRNAGIRYGEHPRYLFYQIAFPLEGDLRNVWAGEWKMKLTGTSQIGDNKIRYSASVLTEGGAELNVSFEKLYYLTGDRVLVKAKLTKKGKPLPGAKIDVYCDVPIVGAGNLLHEGQVSPNELKKVTQINGDKISLIDRKLQILAERAGEEILKRGKAKLELYDDGRHNDGRSKDGIYANSFADTRIPGSYTFRFLASEIPAGRRLRITREWTKSFYNEVDIDPDYSIIKVTFFGKTADGIQYTLKIIPKDRFGNFLGPGHPVMAIISYPEGKRQIQLTDNIDGTYTKKIFITQNEVKAGAKLEIEVDGKRFTTIKLLPPSYGKWSVSIHSGTAVPTGSFANDFKPGFNILMNVDYHLSPQLSLVGLFGYNAFNSKTVAVDDTSWINLSGNIKYRLHTGALSPYLSGGLGYYIPKTGSSGFGVNMGAGFDYNYNNFVTFELGADYHTILDENVQFLHTHAGVIFRF